MALHTASLLALRWPIREPRREKTLTLPPAWGRASSPQRNVAKLLVFMEPSISANLHEDSRTYVREGRFAGGWPDV